MPNIIFSDIDSVDATTERNSYQELLSSLPVAVYTCNSDGFITFYNDAAQQLWGRAPEINKDLWCGSFKIFDVDGMPMLIEDCPMAQTLRTKKPVSAKEILVQRPDGKRLNVMPHPQPIFDRAGNLTGAVNTLIDISEQKKNEGAMLDNQRYYKMVEEVENYAILLLNKEGDIVNWNRGAEKIKGYVDHEIIGKNFRIFYLEEDQKAGLPARLIRQAADEGKAIHEGWRVRKDGSTFWGNILITALHDDNNNVIGFSKVTRDLTEKKLQDDKLQTYARDIEFRNKQLEEYAYVASHDLQEPLRKIRIFTDRIKSNMDNEEIVRGSLSKIEGAAVRMTSLITDVLQYSQLSVSDTLFVETDLNTILDGVINDFDLLISDKQAVISQQQLPTISAIPIQMSQLFSNLVGNAIKFSNRPPKISISVAPLAENITGFEPKNTMDYIKIEVRDNGIGFDDKYGEQIFRLFQRAHNDKKGTGIGLALCKKVVENHGGHIAVRSQINIGTTFTIVLPVSS